jgi:hypothetical protein
LSSENPLAVFLGILWPWSKSVNRNKNILPNMPNKRLLIIAVYYFQYYNGNQFSRLSIDFSSDS